LRLAEENDMKRILLDNHVFDRLKIDPGLCKKIKALAEKQEIEIVIPRTIAEELYRSPHIDVLERFPYSYTGNTVGRVGILSCGDSIGPGDVYYEHLGKSKKFNDASIVDAASWQADWLVSNDDRLCHRATPLLSRCEIMSFDIFRERILDMATTPIEESTQDE
jgi:predicted nucleic acid-binding protein